MSDLFTSGFSAFISAQKFFVLPIFEDSDSEYYTIKGDHFWKVNTGCKKIFQPFPTSDSFNMKSCDGS